MKHNKKNISNKNISSKKESLKSRVKFLILITKKKRAKQASKSFRPKASLTTKVESALKINSVLTSRHK